jgi:flavodoxin I
MAKIGLFYGTQTGNTQTVAELIQKELGSDSKALVVTNL